MPSKWQIIRKEQCKQLSTHLLYGNLTKEQVREANDFKIAQMKCGIESNPNLIREQKDYKISVDECFGDCNTTKT